MSHPNPSYDPENSYPHDVDAKNEGEGSHLAKKKKKLAGKKGEMAKKMFKAHGQAMSSMMKSLKNTPGWFKRGQGGGGLPPGFSDQDNE